MFSFFKNIFKRTQSEIFEAVTVAVFGIGNIGKQYEATRHNLGFCTVDALLKRCTAVSRKQCCNAEVYRCLLPDKTVAVLVKPSTFVNRSGISVKQVLSRYKIPLSSCLVVLDDFNLPLGAMRLRRRGSDGGHNGLRSIIAECGDDFPRLRLGIGPLPQGSSITDFVLNTFEPREFDTKNEMIDRAAEAVVFFCKNGADAAMNTYNSK